MRIEHQKDQTQKVQSEEQQLQRRLQLEQQSASNQIQALKQSLEQSQQQNVEVTSKWHQSEESLRQVSRESSQKMEEMEEVIASLRRMTQDMTSRLYLLEEQNHHLNQQWHTETTNHKILQEESHVKEEQWQHEKKQLLQKVQYLSDKLEELKGRFRQKEQGLKESEQCRQKDQESVATTLHELQQKIDSLQHTNNKYKDDYQTLLDEVNYIHVP